MIFLSALFLNSCKNDKCNKVRLTKNSRHKEKNNARATSFGLRFLQFVSCIFSVWGELVMNTQILRTFGYHFWNNIVYIQNIITLINKILA